MILVIDAYNVLKQALCASHIADSSRQQFIGQLGYYAKKKGHSIILVFDGGSFEWPYKERVNGIQVVHSGIHESADDWIKNYIEHHKAYDILLVSTDRELNSHARRFGIQSLDAIDFYALLQESLGDSMHSKKMIDQKAVKLSESDMPSLDQLMELASRKVITKVEDIMHKERTSKSHTPSKKERHIIQKLKKL
ncbi:MAG: NYN domain-containing protein [Candidatus Babeliales bacterium]|nr:NYN domain-containing protein [Candidatus Babeliales bacterium]